MHQRLSIRVTFALVVGAWFVLVPIAKSPRVRGQDAAVDRPVRLLDLDFACDGSVVVTGGDVLRVFDTASGELRQQVRQQVSIQSVACSPVDRGLFATGSIRGTVCLWRLGEEPPIRDLVGHGTYVSGLSFSPDGTLLVSAGTRYAEGEVAAGELRLWDVESGRLLRRLDFEEVGASCVAFSRDGQHLAVSVNGIRRENEQTSRIEIYELQECRRVRSVPFAPGSATAVTFTPDGTRLLIAGGICVPLTPNTCQPTGKLWIADLSADGPAQLIETSPCDYFRAASLTPAGDLFATGTASVRTDVGARGQVVGQSLIAEIQLRRVDTGELIWSQDGEIGDPCGVTVSRDGELVGCCSDTKVFLFRTQTGEPVRVIDVQR